MFYSCLSSWSFGFDFGLLVGEKKKKYFGS